MASKITVIKIRKISSPNVNEELRWLGNSLGLFGLRDRDSSCFRVFIALLKSSKRNRPLSSDEIAESLRLSRGTVVHHLTRLMESGLVIREKEGYLLRENNLENVIRDIRKDMEIMLEELRETAKEIDRGLGL
ncbi:MAG: ArsR family transcriptional regulator [Candidatus Woesearchaeota archaeon]